MATESGTDTVEFICPKCAHRWQHQYDLLLCQLRSGATIELLRSAGLPVMPPYSASGAPPCGRCGQPTPGRLIERRLEDAPPAP